MKVNKILTSKGGTQSYFIPVKNQNNKYQLVSIPWARLDDRIYNTAEDAVADLTSIVKEVKNSNCVETNVRLSEWTTDRNPKYYHEDYLVTIRDESGDSVSYSTAVGTFVEIDGKSYWIVDNEICRNVIAWQNKPKPYENKLSKTL